MKKVLSSILISFIVFTNLFAPFSVGLDKKEIEVSKNEARADDGGIKMEVTPTVSNNGIKIKVTAKFQVMDGTVEGARVQLKDESGNILKEEEVDLVSSSDDKFTETGETKTLTGLSASTKYYITTEVRQIARLQAGLFQGIIWNVHSLWVEGDNYNAAVKEGSLWNIKIDSQITTLDTISQNIETKETQSAQNQQFNNEDMPACGIETGAKIKGCFAQGFYYILFVPTSYLFALSGIFFDATFAYSIQDSSYRSPFVVEGWGLVRDFCNLFFIFVLLYVAIGTILDLHGFKTKETIIHVIVIGLLINFSLFATQVIIDASNVTARVFYNADTIKIVSGSNTGASDWVSKADENGVIPMSAALVNKINPQNIIMQAKQINNISTKSDGNSGFDTTTGASIGVGSFITIVIMASAVNIIGFIVFLSIGLIFVSRIVGLWVAMILAPLAFFTYIIPSFAKTKMIGWENWWPDTLKLAFLAPVFMFFMYIILKFLELDLIPNSANKNGLAFFLSILMPFAFIIVLLLKAKSIASDMSGEMGKQITGGVAATGGMLLGGAALGTAFLGRKTIGSIAKNIQNDGAREKDLKFSGVKDQWNSMNKLNPFAWAKLAGKSISGTGKATTALVATGFAQIGKQTDPHTGKTTSAFQRETAKISEKEHATHLLDEKSKTVTGNHDATYKDLTEDQQRKVRDNINRDIASKENYNKIYDKLTTAERATLDASKNPADPRGDWADAADISKTAAAARGDHIHTADELSSASKVKTATSEFVNALRKGSYDLRNISKLETVSKGFPKLTVGILSTVALGLRSSLKQSGIEHGTGQKDFMKDLSGTITDALKGIKVEVPKAPSGGGHGGGDAHGGGGGHH